VYAKFAYKNFKDLFLVCNNLTEFKEIF
jgi:hypothetical protein